MYTSPSKSKLDTLAPIEIETHSDKWVAIQNYQQIAEFSTAEAVEIFVRGASALKISVYDVELGHWLCGTLGQMYAGYSNA